MIQTSLTSQEGRIQIPLGHAENLLRGVKIKTKRFSNVASYGGVADAVRSDSTVQNLKDSNGYHTFEILFDQNTKFRLRSYDSANHGNGMGAGFYQSEANGAWETRFPVEGANYLRVENGHTVLSSSTRTLVDAIKSLTVAHYQMHLGSV